MKGPPEPRDRQWPLGQPVPKPAAPAQPEWRPKAGSPGIEVGRDGRLRTNLPLPKG